MNRNANNKDTAFLFILNHNIGQNYFMLGDTGKALDYYRHAHSLLLASSKPNPDYKALSYTSLGTLYLKRGNWKQAEIMLNRALEFAREAGMKGKECDIWYPVDLDRICFIGYQSPPQAVTDCKRTAGRPA